VFYEKFFRKTLSEIRSKCFILFKAIFRISPKSLSINQLSSEMEPPVGAQHAAPWTRRALPIGSNLRWHMLTIVIVMAVVVGGQPAAAQEAPGDTGVSEVTVHVVQYGESLFDIADHYHVTVDSIQAANSLDDADDIRVGQRLIIPPSDSGMLSSPGHVAVVGASDTLFSLAAQYDIAVEQLAIRNHLVNPTRLVIGQTLEIPASSQPDIGMQFARINSEDSFWKIALHSNENAAALILRNNITNPFLIPPGQLLIVQSGGSNEAVSLAEPWLSVVLHPLPLKPGQSAGLRIETDTPGTVQGTFLSADLLVVSEGTIHQALLAVNRWMAPGLYPLSLTFTADSGAVRIFNRQVLVIDSGYGSEIIRVPEDMVVVLNDQTAVQEEFDYISQTMTGFSPERRWDGLFILPAAGVMSSGFGNARTYAGSDYSTFHSGVDFAAPTGTPIYAPANAVVVDSGLLTVRGLVTILDHGWGVYTGYWHQSSILVNPGDSVAAGQQIGTIGNTGLSTAAHVHWEMWVAGQQVDPLLWVRESFP
jgi:murein DD-endopeptidase MepM/ murein hydrolase activator NlpD